MTQRTMLDSDLVAAPAPAAVPVQLPAPYQAQARSPLADLRANALSVPVAQMEAALAEYVERRTCFRKWLLAQMVEGLHFGTVPGCAPKWRDSRGQTCSRAEATHYDGGKAGLIPLTQWVPKCSLYKAGAEFLCDLMGLRAEFLCVTPTDALQKGEGSIVIECRLLSRSNGEIVGQALGGRRVGDKSMDFNASLKMAEKSAQVAAVLSTYGLSDLFSQDLEDLKAPAEPPPANPNAKAAPPRDQRVTKEQLQAALNRYKTAHPDADVDGLAAFVKLACGHQMSYPTNASCWTSADLMAFGIALDKEAKGEPPF